MKLDLQHGGSGRVQFSLAAVFEYTTLCALLSALSPGSGVIASICLMAMALALGARQGLVALATLMAASLSADWQVNNVDGWNAVGRQLTVILVAGLICGWYRLRGSVFGPSTLFKATGVEIPIERPI